MIHNSYIINLINTQSRINNQVKVNNQARINNQVKVNNQARINNQLRLTYKKNKDQEENEDDDDDIDEIIDENDGINENIIDENMINDFLEITEKDNHKKYIIDKFNIKLFLVSGGLQGFPGIWAIKFIPNTGTPVSRFGNAYSYLPISPSLIYTATIEVAQPNYPVGSAIFQGTYDDIINNQLNYGSPLGQTNRITFNGQVYAIERDSANNIYIGGRFSITGFANQEIIQNLAMWNPTTATWSLVNGFNLSNPSQSIMAISIIGSDIFIGGNFNQVNYFNTPINEDIRGFIFWNSTFNIWSSQGIKLLTQIGETASVYVMTFSKDLLYFGGNMFQVVVGGSTPIPVNNIFSLNVNKASSTYLAVRPLQNGTSSDVYTINADTKGNLYVGGRFFSVNPNTTNLTVRYIARWRYNSNASKRKWERIISAQGPSANRTGLNDFVYSIAVNPVNRREIWFGGLFFNDQKRNTEPTAISYIASFNTKNKLWTQRPWTRSISG